MRWARRNPLPETRIERVSPRATAWGAYKTITASLRQRIIRGEFAAGALLPSEAELTAEYGVSRNTLRRALTELEEERLIAVLPGRGRVVTGPGTPRTGAQRERAEPSYRAIAADLRGRIERGELRPGDALPSEADLTTQYGVSRGTARQAFIELQAAGLIDAVQGKGRFVRTSAARDV
jgi:DNA-binding GntR family transcriptional regulator